MVEREVTTPVVVLEVPGDGVGSGVQAGVTEFLAQSPRSSSPHDPSSTRSSIAPSVIAGRVWVGRSVCRLELEPELHGQPPRSLGKAL